MVVGFKASIENDLIKNEIVVDDSEIKKLQDMKKNVFQGINTFEEFKNKLKFKLNSIDDLEYNLKHIESEIEPISKLISTKEEIYKRLLREGYEGENINYKLCEKCFSIIRDIDKKVRFSLNLASEELKKLIINETILFKITPDMEDSINKISNGAKELITTVRVLSSRNDHPDNDLRWIRNDIDKTRSENIPKHNVIGFKK